MSETPLSTKKTILQTGRLNDTTFSAVVRLVAKYPPFSGYSFLLMLTKISDQLRQGANVMVILENKLVAYTGWIVVDDQEAAAWHRDGGKIPEPKWDTGDACIVTITVTEGRSYLRPMIKAVSHVVAGKKVYWMRSYQNERGDVRHAPVKGRRRDYTATER